METEQKEIQAAEAETPQQEAPQPEQRLGSLLKAERERLGLSLEQVRERTRMRTQFIEAIENESWASLPPAVYLRGFLRSYAKVLGVSQDRVMGLYAKSAPAEAPDLNVYPEPPKRGRRTAMLLLLILVILAAGYSLWHFYPFLRVPQGSRDMGKRDQGAGLKTLRAGKEGSPAPSQAAVPDLRPVREVEGPPKQEPAEEQGPSQETLSTPREIGSPSRDQVNDDGWISLAGIVTERTWLRIRIDGKEEKEYLFEPGSRPRWKGKESFNMLIGNAGGIEFELNGKKVGHLGSRGQVVRLTLPTGAEEQERND